MTSDGKLYGPQRFKDIVKERYIISSCCNTSYLDIGNITPLEREYLLSFIYDEQQKKLEYAQKLQAERDSN